MSATGKQDQRLLAKLLLSTALVVVSAGYVTWQKSLTAPGSVPSTIAALPAPLVAAPPAPPAAATAPVAPPPAADVAAAPPTSLAAPSPPVAKSVAAEKPTRIAATAAPTASAAAAPVPATPAVVLQGPPATAIYAEAGSHIEDGDYTSKPEDFQWGTVQIKVQIKNGAFSDVQFLQIPDHRPQSAELTDLSKPILTQETIHDQKAGVDIVSTATYTSMAYQDALADVIVQATRR